MLSYNSMKNNKNGTQIEDADFAAFVTIAD